MGKGVDTRVVILGAGLGGLSCAHELSRSGVRNILVVEKNPSAGGLARSAYTEQQGVKLATEYSWRVFGPRYRNLRKMMKEIPFSGPAGSTVHDRLVDLWDYQFIREDGSRFQVNNKIRSIFSHRGQGGDPFLRVPWSDRLKIAERYLRILTMSDDRFDDELDKTRWTDFLGPLSSDLDTFVVKTCAPILGVDYPRVNAAAMAQTFEGIDFLGNSPISVLDGPSNEVFIDPWVRYLRTLGVEFAFDTEACELLGDGGRIRSVALRHRTTGRETRVDADLFVCAASVEAAAGLIQANPALRERPDLSRVPTLARLGRQVMLCVQLYLDDKVMAPERKTFYYLCDTPWLLVIESIASIWHPSYRSAWGAGIRDQWSVGVCGVDAPGSLFGKPLTACTLEEVRQEVWHQIQSTRGLMSMPTESGRTLRETRMLGFHCWESFQHQAGRFDTWEPKFSPNQATYALRPPTRSSVPNLYFSTAYSRISHHSHLMEGAAEAGRTAAAAILADLDLGSLDVPVFEYTRRWSRVLGPARRIDAALYRQGLPHVAQIMARSVRRLLAAGPRNEPVPG